MIRDLLRYLSLTLAAAALTPPARSADARDPLVFVSAFAPGDKGWEASRGATLKGASFQRKLKPN